MFKKAFPLLNHSFFRAAFTSLCLAVLTFGIAAFHSQASAQPGIRFSIEKDTEEFRSNRGRKLTFVRFQSLDTLEDDHHFISVAGLRIAAHDQKFPHHPAGYDILLSAAPVSAFQRAPPVSS